MFDSCFEVFGTYDEKIINDQFLSDVRARLNTF